jgi:hypothetical protein
MSAAPRGSCLALLFQRAIFGLRRAANVRRRDRLEIIAKLATVLEVEPSRLLRVPPNAAQPSKGKGN